MATRRLESRVRRDFAPSEADTIMELLDALLPADDSDSDEAGDERVQAAVILLAGGDSRRFLDAATLACLDWRDVLVAAGLANEDWQERLDGFLS